MAEDSERRQVPGWWRAVRAHCIYPYIVYNEGCLPWLDGVWGQPAACPLRLAIGVLTQATPGGAAGVWAELCLPAAPRGTDPGLLAWEGDEGTSGRAGGVQARPEALPGGSGLRGRRCPYLAGEVRTESPSPLPARWDQLPFCSHPARAPPGTECGA